MPRHARSGSRVATAAITVLTLAGCGASAAPTGSAPSSAPVSATEAATPSASAAPSVAPASPSADLAPSAAAVIDGRFDIGERSLYLHCAGSGSPTIILEPGDGDRPDAMRPLATELGRDHRICTYDRANMGQSDPAPFQRPVHALADDLDALLTAAGVDGPVVPVGTSLGGLAAWLFSVAHPDRVAGFVAINPPTDMDVWLPAVKPLVTKAEYADEVAYGDGSLGQERYVNSGWIDGTAPPASMPYAIVDSTTTQCEGDPLCLKVYDVIEAQTEAMAERGAGGRWLQVAGSHQLQISNTADVVAIVREVLAEAKT